ncbi:hypothetical protein PM082_003626 [Marasmius tenuissimus]|nr:hypothetical protein PM082_003626 [Marasmius tenuissimus]
MTEISRIFAENGWYNEGTWRSPQNLGTLSSTNDPNARLTFTLSQPAIAFYYYGIGRAYGGLYGICIDGDPNLMGFERCGRSQQDGQWSKSAFGLRWWRRRRRATDAMANRSGSRTIWAFPFLPFPDWHISQPLHPPTSVAL